MADLRGRKIRESYTYLLSSVEVMKSGASGNNTTWLSSQTIYVPASVVILFC